MIWRTENITWCNDFERFSKSACFYIQAFLGSRQKSNFGFAGKVRNYLFSNVFDQMRRRKNKSREWKIVCISNVFERFPKNVTF